MKFTRKLAMTMAVAFVLPFLAVTPAAADDGKAALDLVPEQTMLVMSVNIDGLKKRPIFKEALATLGADPEVKEGLEMLKNGAGFDPEKDLSSVVVAVPPDVEKTDNVLIIAKAKVDEKKLIAFAKKEGAKIAEQKHQGVAWYEIDGEGGVAFVDGHIVAGPKAALKAALDVKAGKAKSVSKNAEVSALIKGVDTSGDAWLAVTLPKEARDQLKAENPAFGDVQAAHASLNLASGLALEMTMQTAKEEAAKSIVALINEGVKAAGAEPQVAAMGLDAVFKNMKVAAAGKNVDISLKLSQAEFDKIVGIVKGFASGLK